MAWPFAGTLHAMPQPPQWFGSLDVSTQPPPHLSKSGSQSKSQTPAVHRRVPFAGATQALSQLPQCDNEELKSTQERLQLTRGVVHEVLQALMSQTSLAGHRLPQLPQLFGSAFRSKQVPTH
jgi:hypothetical protein